MKKPNYVVFDMDDVVAMMRENVSKAFYEMSGVNVPHEEWHVLDPVVLYGVKFCPQTMKEKQIIELCKPEPDAEDAFNSIKDTGAKIAIVTARGWHERGLELTEEWLSKYNLHYDELHVVGREGKTKAFDDISQKGRILAFIDDQPQYLEQAYEHKAVEKTFAFDRPWNQNTNSFDKRVNSLSEFAENVMEISQKLERNQRRKSNFGLSM